MNKVIFTGNLTKDPEVKYTPSNVAYARMSIAVTRPYTSKNNDGQQITDFFNLVAWNKTAEFCGKYLKKGSRVLVEGCIENDNYEDKNGVKHYGVSIFVNSIEFAGGKNPNAEKSDGNTPPDDDDVPVPF